MADELRPCPFCNGPAKIIEGEETAYVQCLDMKMHRALWFAGDNNAANEVADQWNTRPVETALREALRDVGASLVAAISLLERSPKTAAPSNKMFDQMLNDYRASIVRMRPLLQQEGNHD